MPSVVAWSDTQKILIDFSLVNIRDIEKVAIDRRWAAVARHLMIFYWKVIKFLYHRTKRGEKSQKRSKYFIIVLFRRFVFADFSSFSSLIFLFLLRVELACLSPLPPSSHSSPHSWTFSSSLSSINFIYLFIPVISILWCPKKKNWKLNQLNWEDSCRLIVHKKREGTARFSMRSTTSIDDTF